MLFLASPCRLHYLFPMKLRLYTAQIARHFPQATPAQLRLLLAARRTVLKTCPACHEYTKWGALSYQKPDPAGAVKGGICQLALDKGRVVLGFVHGAFLPDPGRLLMGTAKAKRFLVVSGPAVLKDPRLPALLRAAARFDPAG